jgi:molybdopterin synthase catalytic subunit
MRVSVQEADFDVGAETEALAAGRPDVGAVASFVGYVRADKLAGENARSRPSRR